MYHPDTAKEGQASLVQLQKVKDAYSVLGNPKKRKKYDDDLALYISLASSFEGRPVTKAEREQTWQVHKSGNYTFYRPPPGYWTMKAEMEAEKMKKKPEKKPNQTMARAPSQQPIDERLLPMDHLIHLFAVLLAQRDTRIIVVVHFTVVILTGIFVVDLVLRIQARLRNWLTEMAMSWAGEKGAEADNHKGRKEAEDTGLA
ncbi:hypothetical protein BV22DRAFT_1034624 [Leucogyrophana mollusca]|uniref:Uncharacterized protein n=1 Tax=Leucogyrophana mollusca TaxID=85980 RepID=A0ACB8BH84_9AGAM|nr:hypothetical protein BV22DRAFT_1034624 [Leucogyrophana mollusca]